MKYFFHSGISSSFGDAVSSVTIKQRIRKIIEAEDAAQAAQRFEDRQHPAARRAWCWRGARSPSTAKSCVFRPRTSARSSTNRRAAVMPPSASRHGGTPAPRARRTRSASALELLAGAAGLDRPITSPYIQKTGLALAGYHEYLRPGRVLIYGDSEVRYLQSLAPAGAARSARRARSPPASRACSPRARCRCRPRWRRRPTRAGVPLLRTSMSTPLAIGKLMSMLEDRLASREVVHGVLMDVLGLGVLLVGESGIGKSECALDLVGRGHRLVADDAVEVRRRAETVIIGTAPVATRYFMEIRGLGPDQRPRAVRRGLDAACPSASNSSSNSSAGIRRATTIGSVSTTLHHDAARPARFPR